MSWIKWTVGLPEKPEVVRIAATIGKPREIVACCLMRLWEWADANVPDTAIQADGSAVINLSPSRGDNVVFLDDVAGADGLCVAMQEVGWLAVGECEVWFPNFARHNGQTAKTRARNSRAQQRKRDADGGRNDAVGASRGDQPVTKTSPSRGDKKVTRGEERRGEELIPPNPPAGGDTPNTPPVKSTAKPPTAESPEDVPLPTTLDTPGFRQTWDLWIGDRKSRKKAMTALAARQQLQKLILLGPEKAVECINESIANGWLGLFPERFTQSGQPRKPMSRSEQEEADYLRILNG